MAHGVVLFVLMVVTSKQSPWFYTGLKLNVHATVNYASSDFDFCINLVRYALFYTYR